MLRVGDNIMQLKRLIFTILTAGTVCSGAWAMEQKGLQREEITTFAKWGDDVNNRCYHTKFLLDPANEWLANSSSRKNIDSCKCQRLVWGVGVLMPFVFAPKLIRMAFQSHKSCIGSCIALAALGAVSLGAGFMSARAHKLYRDACKALSNEKKIIINSNLSYETIDSLRTGIFSAICSVKELHSKLSDDLRNKIKDEIQLTNKSNLDSKKALVAVTVKQVRDLNARLSKYGIGNEDLKCKLFFGNGTWFKDEEAWRSQLDDKAGELLYENLKKTEDPKETK
jgi:hypothetical protein